MPEQQTKSLEAVIRMPGEVANCFAHLTSLVQEGKLRVESDQAILETTHVDPANVGMGQIKLSLDPDLGVEAVDLPGRDMVTGISLEWLRGRIKWARKAPSGGDPVELRLQDYEGTEGTPKNQITIEREVIRQSTQAAIDPDSIRKEPDPPGLDLPCQTDRIEAKTFVRAIEAIKDGGGSHVRISGDARGDKLAGDLVLTSELDTGDEEVRIPECLPQGDWDQDVSSLFSTDYLTDIAGGIKRASPDKVWLIYGEEFPVEIKVDAPEFGVEAKFLVAPRIQDA